ncbi:class I SAM-dependent methyltransferase [Microbacterium marinilacus]|uniref:Class I SAM-dependent methyltransferase n=1 Tax=Microbacterium marinilacus TaxID=415209 RepID=A0ABP7B8L4_9MICO|nr:class I SAM-dependent methyltransferase [Microbacterium marinilacus]MBY0687439.1 class I SAM-dependent methyltransferase [Microbacterium marinilacus]
MSVFSSLVRRWDAQQAAYITDRDERFQVMLDVLAAGPGKDGALVVVDLGCGPGSLAARILERFPDAVVVGVDYDPVQLRLAAIALEPFGDRFMPVDADLASPGWSSALPVERIDAAVSSTALHWLPPAGLVAVYAELAGLVREDGVVLDADHLRFDEATQPLLSALAAGDDARTQEAARAAGVPTWDEWWYEALTVPELAAHADERDRRFRDRPAPPDSPLALHLEALRAAGFRETGTVWQLYDDYVVLARR